VTETNEREFSESLAAEMAERGIVVCPTINVNAPYVTKLTGITVGENVRRMWERGVRIIAGTDAGIDNTPHHQYAGGLAAMVSLLGFSPAEVIAMATTEAAAALGLGAVTGRLAPGYEADLIVVDGDPLADIAALGRLRRVVARGRDYVPDSGRFDVSAPGTPFASRDRVVDLRLIHEATRVRQPGGRSRPEPSVHAVQEHERSDADRDHDQGEQHAEYFFPEDRAGHHENEDDGPGALNIRG